MVVGIASHLIYLICIGRKDISGSDWGDALAEAIGGRHLDAPVGIADVVKEKMAWSVKTVKKQRPIQYKKRQTHQRKMLSGLFLWHNRPA